MDVYTNPPENAYILGVPFQYPRETQTLTAVSIRSPQYPLVIAAYSIIIQLCIALLWGIVTELCLLHPPRSRHEWIVLVVIRNASEPWTACTILLSHLVRAVFRRQHARGERVAVMLLTFPALVLAVGGILATLLYTENMSLGNAAPVSPSAVYVPYIEDVASSTSHRIAAYYKPAILRALGSSESVEDSTRRSSVNVRTERFSTSNATRPLQRISYDYTISAYDLGLQAYLGFAIKDGGSCFTEYNWLRPRTSSPPGYLDEYIIFGDESLRIPVAGPKNPTPSLSFIPYINTSVPLETTNLSYALVATTAVMGSFTASTDPWYLTERAQDNDEVPYHSIGVPYRIKPGRPVLSCWEDTVFCNGGDCKDVYHIGLPKGLGHHMARRLTVPMIVDMGLIAGSSALKSYLGLGQGMVLDAGSSSMSADMERLVLAAYLATKEILRDAAVTGKLNGARNVLQKPDGKLHDGAADFVLRTGDVVAIRFDLLLLAPLACVAVLMTTMGLRACKRFQGRERSSWTMRWQLLTAPQLFRLFDERFSDSRWNVGSTRSCTPILESQDETGLCRLEPGWNGRRGVVFTETEQGHALDI